MSCDLYKFGSKEKLFEFVYLCCCAVFDGYDGSKDAKQSVGWIMMRWLKVTVFVVLLVTGNLYLSLPVSGQIFSRNGIDVHITVRNRRMQVVPTDKASCRFYRNRIKVLVRAAGYRDGYFETSIVPGQQNYRAELILEDQSKPLEILDLDFMPVSSAYVDLSQFGIPPDEFAVDLFLPCELMSHPASAQFLLTNSLWWSYPIKRQEVTSANGFYRIRLVVSRESFATMGVIWVIVPMHRNRSGVYDQAWLPDNFVNVRRLMEERRKFDCLHERTQSVEPFEFIEERKMP